MASFTITPVEKGIMRCKHTDKFSPEDVQMLSKFVEDYQGKLLVDLTETTAEQCSKHLKEFRSMMPTTAIFGAEIDPEILTIDESYYTHEVRFFDTEAEALEWLRNQ